MNLQLDNFDDAYIRSATIKTCPHCTAEVELSALIVGRDGTWRVGGRADNKARKAAVVRQFDAQTDKLDFPYDYNLAETVSLHALANHNGHVDIDLLRRISLWKLNRILDVPEETMKRLQALATDADLQAGAAEVRELIGQLVECAGIGMPMASTILKFLRPDVFPIIDVRAYRALYGKKLYWPRDSVERNIDRYLAYVSDVEALSKATGRPLRDIDEQLYCFDRKHNGAI